MRPVRPTSAFPRLARLLAPALSAQMLLIASAGSDTTTGSSNGDRVGEASKLRRGAPSPGDYPPGA
jgi:hypothetical protein